MTNEDMMLQHFERRLLRVIRLSRPEVPGYEPAVEAHIGSSRPPPSALAAPAGSQWDPAMQEVMLPLLTEPTPPSGIAGRESLDDRLFRPYRDEDANPRSMVNVLSGAK